MAQSKMTTISTRLSQADVTFLHTLGIDGARTPSEKIRRLVERARQRIEGAGSYSETAGLIDDLARRSVRRIKELEHNQGMHSEAVAIAMRELPETLAHVLSQADASNGSPQSLRELEAETLSRIFRLCVQVLRLAVTREAPCYEPGIVRKQLQPLADIWELIDSGAKRRTQGDGNV